METNEPLFFASRVSVSSIVSFYHMRISEKLTTALGMNIKNGNFSHEKIRAHVEGELRGPSTMLNECLGLFVLPHGAG